MKSGLVDVMVTVGVCCSLVLAGARAGMGADAPVKSPSALAGLHIQHYALDLAFDPSAKTVASTVAFFSREHLPSPCGSYLSTWRKHCRLSASGWTGVASRTLHGDVLAVALPQRAADVICTALSSTIRASRLCDVSI